MSKSQSQSLRREFINTSENRYKLWEKINDILEDYYPDNQNSHKGKFQNFIDKLNEIQN